MVCGGGCTHSDRDATDSFNGRSRHRTPANIEVLRGSRRERSRRLISAIHPGDSISAHSLSAWATAEKSAGARSAQYEMSSTRSREAGWPICAAAMVCARYPRGVTAMECAGWWGAGFGSERSHQLSQKVGECLPPRAKPREGVSGGRRACSRCRLLDAREGWGAHLPPGGATIII